MALQSNALGGDRCVKQREAGRVRGTRFAGAGVARFEVESPPMMAFGTEIVVVERPVLAWDPWPYIAALGYWAHLVLIFFWFLGAHCLLHAVMRPARVEANV